MQQVINAVDGDFADAVQTGDKGVAAGCMGADFLALSKGKECDADRVILRQCFADYLTLLLGNLFCESQRFGLTDSFHLCVHKYTSGFIMACQNGS